MDAEKLESFRELTKEQREFAEKNYKILLKFMNIRGLPTEVCEENNTSDWYGICAIGFCKAVRTFNVGIGTKFSSYAFKCMNNEVNEEYDRLKKGIPEDGVKMVSLDDDSKISLWETIPNHDSSIESKVCFELEMEEMEKLLTKDEKIVANYLNMGYSRDEIAEIMEKEFKEIKNLKRSIIRKREKYLKSDKKNKKMKD